LSVQLAFILQVTPGVSSFGFSLSRGAPVGSHAANHLQGAGRHVGASPDLCVSHKILFESGAEIYVMNASGTGIRRLERRPGLGRAIAALAQRPEPDRSNSAAANNGVENKESISRDG
jgi:hypothetical protein